ncbi:hypothetical protein WJX84_008607 [Apatococcus fuscideae]|uniref:STEEP1 domain-containing protein n=1 Tax=Apatococcus fuscideae TaxID=2026836 RepID=A0AAW1RXU3_9CHLO
MPRRATLTYSSEDAPQLGGDELHVYYCRYSGKHALTTECDLLSAPRRRADHSRVLDLEAYTSKLYMTEGGSKLIRRANGNVEKQHRLLVGKLPVAYSAEGNNRYLYILDGALTSYAKDEQLRQDGGAPVPPCITLLEAGVTQVSLEIDDRTDRPSLIKISADYVRIGITQAISHSDANEEILEFMRAMLGVRLGQLTLWQLSGEAASQDRHSKLPQQP